VSSIKRFKVTLIGLISGTDIHFHLEVTRPAPTKEVAAWEVANYTSALRQGDATISWSVSKIEESKPTHEQ
jgi:hypothetical protein